jgi:hypothetical protein
MVVLMRWSFPGSTTPDLRGLRQEAPLFPGKLFDERRVLFRDIGVLMRIDEVVVEFGGDGPGGLAIDPFNQAVSPRAHGVTHVFAALMTSAELTECGCLERLVRFVQQGRHAAALQMIGLRNSGQVAEGGVDVDELDQGI